MKLSTAKRILIYSCVIMMICFLVGGAMELSWLIVLGGAAALIGAFIWCVFGRCPHCRKFLMRGDDTTCRRCGKPIE